MKYHKIRGVDKNICTAEQKIAYNLAWANSDYILRAGFTSYADAAQKLVEMYTWAYDYKPGKYDIDSIFCALNTGLKNYINGKQKIFTTYEEIGNAFPALYMDGERV